SNGDARDRSQPRQDLRPCRTRDRLLDELGVIGLQLLEHAPRLHAVPDLVCVEAQARIADRLTNRLGDLEVEGLTPTDLHIDDVEALLHQAAGMLGELGRFVALNEAEIADAVPDGATKDPVQRLARRLADGIP